MISGVRLAIIIGETPHKRRTPPPKGRACIGTDWSPCRFQSQAMHSRGPRSAFPRCGGRAPRGARPTAAGVGGWVPLACRCLPGVLASGVARRLTSNKVRVSNQEGDRNSEKLGICTVWVFSRAARVREGGQIFIRGQVGGVTHRCFPFFVPSQFVACTLHSRGFLI